MPQVTVCAASREINDIEFQLRKLDQDAKLINEKRNELKSQLIKVLEDGDMKRTVCYRVSKNTSSGALDTSALCRHFGCSPSFLSQFRKKGKTTTYLVKAKEPKNPKMVYLDEVDNA